MKIFNDSPIDWRDLQEKVKIYFEEIGYYSIVGKTIDCVRGRNEIDVYVESLDELKICIFIECKNWEANIPQREINAFRTVVDDGGANVGYFIVKNGFQSGAYESSKFTNLKLLTYNQLIDTYFNMWSKSILFKIMNKLKILKKYDSLIRRTRVVPHHIIGFKTQEQWNKATELINKIDFLYYHISVLDSNESNYKIIFQRLLESSPKSIKLQEDVKIINTIRDYLNLVLYSNYIDEVCIELDQFIKNHSITLYMS
ncbi:restriction endonuclease [Herbivorax sp. ANBcel31]|uniref:restriction endonuclease n=1 Tax=Herbivorax sp. ANBcel31 TaxID=3069754 RepID=UPI0027B36F4C|nr:restriction endonuclease [Herbivorax sp. ANBcel31]MDQ2088264.1 restriction endonuclease [Herbivorax sp. ANBcel31]